MAGTLGAFVSGLIVNNKRSARTSVVLAYQQEPEDLAL